MLDYIGYAFIFLGVINFLVSTIGLIRMPDVYTRMHVGTKATTMGTLLVIIGAMFIEPTWAFKLGLIAIFILLTNPLSSSVIARASYHDFINNDSMNLEIDELKEKRK